MKRLVRAAALSLALLVCLCLSACTPTGETAPSTTPTAAQTATPTPTLFLTPTAEPMPAPTPEPTSTPESTPPPTPIPTEPITDPERTIALVEGFYHRPFEELPQDLRDSLEWDGEVYESNGIVMIGGEEHIVFPNTRLRYYIGPGIAIMTTEAAEEYLQERLAEQLSLPEGDERRVGTDEEIRAEYEQERGREWLYSVTITSDSYATLLGLKVSDTLEEAAALGYDLSEYLDDEGTGRSYFGPAYADTLTVYIKNGVVEEMYLGWGLGRHIGKYWD